jgi:hypothetical protein
MLYQNRQVVLSQLSPFSGQSLVKLPSVEFRGERCHNCARGSYNAQKGARKAHGSRAISRLTAEGLPTAAGAAVWNAATVARVMAKLVDPEAVTEARDGPAPKPAALRPRGPEPGRGRAGPTEPPRVRSARSANRAKAWHADRTRTAAYLAAKARDDEERTLVERAYEEEMARGPDFIHYRGRSVFQAAARVGLDRNAFGRIMRAIEAIERGVYRTGRRKGAQGVGRAVPKVLKVLLNLTLKFGRQVFPTLVNIADWACACKDAVVDAIKFLAAFSSEGAGRVCRN